MGPKTERLAANTITSAAPALAASPAQWAFHPLTKTALLSARVPGPNELFLWRIYEKWRLVSAMDVGRWLSKPERTRVKTDPNTARGKRFGFVRGCLRFVLSHVFACEPQQISITELGDGRLAIGNTRDGRSVFVDVGDVGVWTVIAVSASEVGLGFATSDAGDASRFDAWQHASAEARAISESRAKRGASIEKGGTSDSADESEQWPSVGLPALGVTAACVTVRERITVIQSFGWQ